MDTDFQDDFFSDADLDDLPANTLIELEQRAFASTQRPVQLIGNHSESLELPQGFSALGLNNLPQEGEQQLAEFDYGFDDDTIINLDEPAEQQHVAPPQINRETSDEVVERDLWRRNRYGTAARATPQPSRGPQVHAKFRPPTLVASQSAHRQPTNGFVPPQHTEAYTLPLSDVTALQARILELEQEQLRLRRATEDANTAAFAKAGEISIVRANQEKTAKDYDRRIAVLQHQHAEETKKQKDELEAIRQEKNTLETEKRFLEHEMVQNGERVRAAKKTTKEGQRAQESPAGTPSKKKNLTFRDGFDDDEVMLVSPTKPKCRGRPGTPKAGSKRKRAPSAHSPALPMLFDEVENLPTAATPPIVAAAEDATVHSAANTREEILQFVRAIINYRPEPGALRILETLTEYTFPSDTNTTLASSVYDSIAQISMQSDIESSRNMFCQTLLSLWEQCIAEDYFIPLYDLTDMLQHVLLNSAEPLAGLLMSRLIPLSVKTIDLIAMPMAKAASKPSVKSYPSERLMCDVDPLDSLDLLHLTASNASLVPETILLFWSSLELDHILTWLSRAQPLAQITLVLQLLATSILPDSFGPVVPEHSKSNILRQTKSEVMLVERLLNLLFDVPQLLPDEEPYTASELVQLRLDVLRLLRELCTTQHGGHLLATHALCVGRLVRLLHDSVLAMYAYKENTHNMTLALVNGSVLLLAHLTTSYREVVDLRVRLAAVPSGVHKHLVALSRVAFHDGVSVLENGIRPEVKEAAHRMLDEHLSLEEGDAVVELFPSAG